LQAHVMWQKGVAASLFCLNLFLPPHRSQARPRMVVTLKFQTSILQSKCFLTKHEM